MVVGVCSVVFFKVGGIFAVMRVNAVVVFMFLTVTHLMNRFILNFNLLGQIFKFSFIK